MKRLSASRLSALMAPLRRVDSTSRSVRDAGGILAVALLAYIASEYIDLMNRVMKLQSIYGDWGLDDLVIICVVLSFALAAYAWRRLQDLTRENQARRAAEAEAQRNPAQLAEAQRFLHTIIENVPAMIFVRDYPEGRHVLINRAAEKLHGIPREKLLGLTVAECLPDAVARKVADHDRELVQAFGPVTFGERPVTLPTAGDRIMALTAVAIRDDDGKPQYLVNVVEDVTERKRAEAQVRHLAHHDPLTDLPNRAAFNECLQSTIDRAAAAGEGFAMIWIDLNRFKEVNDVFGHAVGDAVLRELAHRLEAASGGAFLARLGGDEFAVICIEPSHVALGAALAETLLHVVDDAFAVGGHVLRIGMSVGVAIYPADGADAAALLANADAALYRAKSEAGGASGSICFFEPAMDERVRDNRALQHDLRSALSRGELMLHYQPQASITGAVTGFEALVRWNHPRRGMVLPMDFIPLAETSGLIVEMGEGILREACREAASWAAPLAVAVNVSPVQFRQGDLPTQVHAILLESGLAPERLEIEITEGILIDDFARAVAVLRRLKALGVRIAMDDFGTGYSSLSYLQALPFDKIKIDRTFIANLDRNPQSAAIIRAVIGLGHGLDLPVAAEGVETKEQLAFLEREGCNEVQGYLVGRPAPIERYAELVHGKGEGAVVALAS